MSRDCVHGSLARSCEVCELEAELAAARTGHRAAVRALSQALGERDRLADGIQRYIDSEHTASGANYAWTHRLNSEDWECTRCGNAWPCPTERLRVLLDGGRS